MTDLRFFLGYPVDFKGICKVYPPTVEDVVSKQEFNIYQGLLTMSQEDIEDQMAAQRVESYPTPLEALLGNAYYNDNIKKLISQAFLFFTHETATILFEQKAILIGDLEDILKNAKTMDDFRMITEDNFFEFQNLIRQSCGGNVIDPPNPNEDPRIKRMKAKARERDRVKAKSGKGIRFDTTIVSICCMDLGLNPLNIGKLSYCALTDLMNTYQKKEKYQLDIDSLLAGADSKKVKPKYWISNE